MEDVSFDFEDALETAPIDALLDFSAADVQFAVQADGSLLFTETVGQEETFSLSVSGVNFDALLDQVDQTNEDAVAVAVAEGLLTAAATGTLSIQLSSDAITSGPILEIRSPGPTDDLQTGFVIESGAQQILLGLTLPTTQEALLAFQTALAGVDEDALDGLLDLFDEDDPFEGTTPIPDENATSDVPADSGLAAVFAALQFTTLAIVDDGDTLLGFNIDTNGTGDQFLRVEIAGATFDFESDDITTLDPVLAIAIIGQLLDEIDGEDEYEEFYEDEGPELEDLLAAGGVTQLTFTGADDTVVAVITANQSTGDPGLDTVTVVGTDGSDFNIDITDIDVSQVNVELGAGNDEVELDLDFLVSDLFYDSVPIPTYSIDGGEGFDQFDVTDRDTFIVTDGEYTFDLTAGTFDYSGTIEGGTFGTLVAATLTSIEDIDLDIESGDLFVTGSDVGNFFDLQSAPDFFDIDGRGGNNVLILSNLSFVFEGTSGNQFISGLTYEFFEDNFSVTQGEDGYLELRFAGESELLGRVRNIAEFAFLNPENADEDTIIAASAILLNQVVGTEGDDNLTGTDGVDRIQGLGGNDIFSDGAGDDEVIGGEGNDTLNAGVGADIFDGGAGIDTVNVDVSAFPDSDLTAFFNMTTGEHGAVESEVNRDEYTNVENYNFTGNWDTEISDSAADNDITTDEGDDEVEVSDGDDDVDTGAGDDEVIVSANGTGTKTLDGGAGNDLLSLSGFDPNNSGHTFTQTTEGGVTSWTFQFNDLSITATNFELIEIDGEAFTVGQLESGATNEDGQTIGDATSAVEQDLEDGFGTSTIQGGTADDDLNSGGGGDTVNGGDGDDNIFNEGGNDTINGGAGNDTGIAANGNNTFNEDDDVTAGTATPNPDRTFNDFYCGGGGDDNISTGAGNDVLVGETAVWYRTGSDTLNGGTGDDIMQGAYGDDTFVFTDNHGVDIIARVNISSVFGFPRPSIDDVELETTPDFQFGIDTIRFVASGDPASNLASNFGQLNITDSTITQGGQNFNGALINTGEGSIFVSGVSAADFSASDFDFV